MTIYFTAKRAEIGGVVRLVLRRRRGCASWARIIADQHFGVCGGAAHQPDRRLAIVVLPQDVGVAIAAEIAGADYVPARSGVRPDQHLAERGGAVHQPDRRLTIGVLPQYVGFAVAVEIACADNVPARSRVADH